MDYRNVIGSLSVPTSNVTSNVTTPVTLPAANAVTYTVQQGDTLYAIANRYNLTTSQILNAPGNQNLHEVNGIVFIVPGEQIVIPLS